ncbi:MAG: hypothetical protein HY706_16490 [Candidatus Hydrogenedentes bacterium]|nr:hypothetical protein [Candidatus Hydrogenedentota bacterium]
MSAPPANVHEDAHLAAEALEMNPTCGIPSWLLHVMDVAFIEHRTGYPSGVFVDNPDEVYVAFQRAVGTCMLDQYLASNCLTMGQHGFEGDTPRSAATGAQATVLDGILIDSPEAVVEHLERFVFPVLEREVREFDSDSTATVKDILARERKLQRLLGDCILKVPYGNDFCRFPCLRYTQYGYENYLTAYAIYPEIMERDFGLQAELAALKNRLGVRAIIEGNLPRVVRSDHDMADSRGTLVDVRSLDKLWFPHFERAVRPHLEAGIRLIWHCDGNLMEMTPRLIEVGISGFQGFQYEDGMDYERICRMTTRDGNPLMVWAGVSVTRTLPFGTVDDVRRELDWLVREGPPVGLFLGGSSSITPGVSWENLNTLIEGLQYYRDHGRP